MTTVGWGGMREYSAEYGEGELSTASKRLVNVMLAWIHGCTLAISVRCNMQHCSAIEHRFDANKI